MTDTEFHFDRNTWKARVKALLAKAEQASTQDEAAAYTAKAAELMAAKQIDQAELDAMQQKRPEEKIVAHTFRIMKPIIQRGILLNAIVTNFDGMAVRPPRPRKQKFEVITVYAFETDLTVIQMLWASVVVQGERFLAQENIPVGIHPPTYKRAWWAAFATETFYRLEREKQKAMAASTVPGTAVAIRDKQQQVKDDVSIRYGQLRGARRTSRRRNEGYAEGRAAAQRVDISGSDKLGGTKRSIER